MKRGILFTSVLLFVLSCTLFAGCSHTAGQPAERGGLTITAAFERENGAALSNRTIRFSDGNNSAEYRSDQEGTLNVSGLPTQGDLAVTILDGQQEPQGTITLAFSQGSVIDAVTDENSVGHITLKQDTREIALKFTLQDGGALQCMLQLSG